LTVDYYLRWKTTAALGRFDIDPQDALNNPEDALSKVCRQLN
jgi:hypothetical protein